MIRQKTLFCFALCSVSSVAQGYAFHGEVQCKGVSSVTTKISPAGAEVKREDSKDQIWLSRRASTLIVQINPESYATLDAKTRRELQEPEQYKVVGETGEGLTAIHIASAETTTEQTLILRSDSKRAVWIETGFTSLPPQSEPLSTTVSLNCKKVK